MRAQFYLLSIVIIAITITNIAAYVLQSQPSGFEPLAQDIDFLVNNLEAEAKTAYTRGTLTSYFDKTEEELGGEFLAVGWERNATLVTLTLKTEKTIFEDTFSLR